jgi:predicted phosphohydrolase
MKVFIIGDLHLSLNTDKPMDVFNGWSNYVEKLKYNWQNNISSDDIVVLAGDISWGMSLKESLKDFQFIDSLPGQKYIIKGNHDYWWDTRSKIERFWNENNLTTLHLLHNSSIETEKFYLCGTRGWLFENSQPHDIKISAREAGRLELSLNSCKGSDKEKVVVLHYPPVFCDEIMAEMIDVMKKHNVKRCFYGHLHSDSIKRAFNGTYLGIDFRLISSDALGFCPIEIE